MYRRITGKQIAIRLSPVDAPIATLHTAPRVSLQVQPPGDTQGPLHYVDLVKCPPAVEGGIQDIQQVDWRPVSGAEIDPPCSHPLAWHVIAGWVGRSIAPSQLRVFIGEHGQKRGPPAGGGLALGPAPTRPCQ